MDAASLATAQSCLEAAHDGSLSFPEIVGKLIAAGFEGYQVDYRLRTQTFYLPGEEGTEDDAEGQEDGRTGDQGGAAAEGVTLALPSTPGSVASRRVAARFDAGGIEALVRWAQEAGPDYSYPSFSERAKACGCSGYLVSFPGRRVVYYGRSGETHVEHFP